MCQSVHHKVVLSFGGVFPPVLKRRQKIACWVFSVQWLLWSLKSKINRLAALTQVVLQKTHQFLWKQSLYKTNHNPPVNSCQCINTGQSSLLLSFSQSKCMLHTSLKADPMPLIPHFHSVAVIPDFFYYRVPLKHEDDAQETQLN